MIEMIRDWYHRHFSNPQVVMLAFLLIMFFTVIILFGNMLLPLLTSIVIAYLLETLVQRLEKLGASRVFAASLVFTIFMLTMVYALIELIPLVSTQIAQFFDELPRMIGKTQKALLTLPESYPGFIAPEQVNDLMRAVRSELAAFGQNVLQFSLSGIKNIISGMVYALLVSILVFFFLKDKRQIGNWFARYMPRDRALVQQVWHEMDQQIGNYIRGKIIEIIIVGGATYIVFALMGMNYAVLLGILVGLSVLVPYVGATVVTIPVALVAFFQWGWSTEFFYLLLAYGIVQAIDGNVIVPLLFSEAVNLHPVSIIIAIVVFGGMWGFWGVFFAIPLATLVKAVLRAWPNVEEVEQGYV